MKQPETHAVGRSRSHADALQCRELQVQFCYRLFGILAGLNRRYFTVFQFKRTHRLAGRSRIAPHTALATVQNRRVHFRPATPS